MIKKKDDKKDPKEKDKKEKKPDSIKDKMNDIKKMAFDIINQCKKNIKLTPNETMKLTNTVLKNHKVFSNAHKKNLNFPKKICKELNENADLGLQNLNKLLNEKKDKFNFDKEVSPPIPAKKDGENPLKRQEDEAAQKAELKLNVNYLFNF